MLSVIMPTVVLARTGVGEYVHSPTVGNATTQEDRRLFAVSPNAVIVNTATPVAIARAVHHLIVHPQLREELGVAGRRTVTERFHLARQMDQYSDLYGSLTGK